MRKMGKRKMGERRRFESVREGGEEDRRREDGSGR